MVGHPQSITDGRYFVLKFRLNRIYSFGESAISIFWHFGLNCLFTPTFRGVRGHILPQMTSSVVLTPKGTSKPSSVKIGPTVRPGCVPEKKTRQSKSHKGVIFHLHCVSKNDTDVAHYNFDAGLPI